MRQVAPKVVLVAMSRGSTRVPSALSAGPDAIVFTSSMLDHVRQTVGSASALPPTLVIHHRRDDCHVTHYDMVPPFMHRQQAARGSSGAMAAPVEYGNRYF
jgi:hypothetical protein